MKYNVSWFAKSEFNAEFDTADFNVPDDITEDQFADWLENSDVLLSESGDRNWVDTDDDIEVTDIEEA